MLALYMSFIDNEDDRDKFEIIYYKYRKRMLAMAYSVLHNKEDAEDVVHDTFIKIAKNINSIDEPDSDRTLSYVLKAAKNTAINLKKKNEKREKIEHLEDVENIPDELFYEKLDISNNYREVVEAIRSLDDTYRDAMYYHFVEEMKISEIADLLGRKKSAVKQQLVRGKRLLLEILNRE